MVEISDVTAKKSLASIEQSAIRKVSLRLVPFLIIAYFMAYLDRVNVGFAALEMNADLSFTPTIYSIGAGIFFVGYFLFEVPSNYFMEKLGARLWIARILITWGLISCFMALIVGQWSFYGLRLLLGLAEAGFFPGILLYLTYWYPSRYRARILAGFVIAVPISTLIGAPISGILLEMHGFWGLRGWQWLFIIEGVPTVILGIIAWFYLTDRPSKAKWLTNDEKNWLENEIAMEAEKGRKVGSDHSFMAGLTSPRVLILCFVYFSFVAALYAMSFWLPQIIKAFGLSNVETGFVTAIPYFFAAIAMVLWGIHSDRTGERIWHVILPFLLASIALITASFLQEPIILMVALTFAAIGIFCCFSLFWTLPTAFLTGSAAAAGIALINSVGNLAGFGGPYLMGWIKETTSSASLGLLILGILPLFGAALVYYLGKTNRHMLDAHK
ncbi:MFS transporter [Bartonella sp. HY761]|uniref:MFS transporter n=1 Tax=Bartonella sp. HY761 TaxID=2979330 RepID=UPI0021E24C5F|nr:MFS transporter [Bartonella sp. HY761]UXN08079.1 MFS transporter [Bartonella sp. HY761]